ncbi:MAG TPA: hypothetical protein VL563_03885 [Gemmatimonadales bacterium]|nr:hypothetical protein [Gemmatimonadales bacterium]
MALRVRASLLPAALGAVLACGGSVTGPAPSTPRVDFVDGAIEPLLVRGQAIVIEGFGFGDSQAGGAIDFPKAGGGAVLAPVPAGGWSDRLLRSSVPESATSGVITVTTADGRHLTATVHVLPHVPFDPATLTWQTRPEFPGAPAGVALTVAAEPQGAGVKVAVYAAGGGEPVGGDSAIVPDSSVFTAHAAPGGAIGGWTRQAALPAPRAYAAAAAANRFNSRVDGHVLYVIGGLDSAGRARATVFQAFGTADTALLAFTTIEALPAPVAGAMAVVRRGRIYVMGGVDSLGRPQTNVFVGRIGLDGHIDGWFVEPSLPTPRAYGGGVVLDDRVTVFGGVADSTPPGGGLDTIAPRLATADTAPASLLSGFFTGGWAPAAAPLVQGRSQFATLRFSDVLLVVGGVYAGAQAGSAETLAASLTGGDSLGGFTGPVGTNTILALGGGALVGPGGTAWLDADGSGHGLVVGGIDLVSRERRAAVWGF